MQDAVPVTLGQEFAGYANVTQRAIDRIEHSLNHFYTLNMGATAVGTGLNAEPEYIVAVVKAISELTGKEFKSAGNLIDATQNLSLIHI